MNYVKFLGSEKTTEMEIKVLSEHLIQLFPPLPNDFSNGFEVLTAPDGKVFGDFSKFKTIYRIMDDESVILSNDGSIWEPPVEIPQMPEYVPTLEEIKEQKVSEMNSEQQNTIARGIDIVLSDGISRHFTLTEHDQISLMGLQSMVEKGIPQIPWHTSDQTEQCQYYSNQDMAIITQKSLEYVTYHVTYFRDLRIYIRSLLTKEEVNKVFYGMIIPAEHQSDVLKDYTRTFSL